MIDHSCRLRFSPRVLGLLAIVGAVCLAGCGKRDAAPDKPEVPVETIARPGPADRSSWFPVDGPDKLGEPCRLDSTAGIAGIHDAVSFCGGLAVLDFSGRVLCLSKGGDEPIIAKTLYPEDESLDAAATAVSAREDTFFMADAGGTVRAARLSEGQSLENLWRSSPGLPADELLVSGDGYLVCLSREGAIEVLSASGGERISRLDLGEPLIGPSSIAGSVLLVAKAAGASAFSLPDLQFLWKSDFAPDRGKASLTCNKVLAVADDSGFLHVLDALPGTERYSVPFKDGRVASDGERLYVADSDGNLSAYNLMDGVPVWTTGASSLANDGKAEAPSEAPRLAVAQGRVFLARHSGFEVWDSAGGELVDRVEFFVWPDRVAVLPGVLVVAARGDGLYCMGSWTGMDGSLPMETILRPDGEAARRMTAALVKYADPGSPVPRIAWRTYVDEATMVEGVDYTAFRYETKEAGKRLFTIQSVGSEGALLALFDSNGEERHANIGELGVDKAFDQWLEAGTWFAVVGPLRGQEDTKGVFLKIR